MADQPIRFTSGIPSTELPPEDPAVVDALERAIAEPDPVDAVEAVVAMAPRSPLAWATLGDVGTSPVRRYAAYRVGYHRGLDALRASGWRGSGYVRWNTGGNNGFLRAMVGLQSMATLIGERDEATRIEQFLTQLDPTGAPAPVSEGPQPLD